MDGGKTWSVEEFDGLRPGGASLSADEHLANDLKTRPRLRAGEDLRDHLRIGVVGMVRSA
jgi:hypothetical protein